MKTTITLTLRECYSKKTTITEKAVEKWDSCGKCNTQFTEGDEIYVYELISGAKLLCPSCHSAVQL